MAAVKDSLIDLERHRQRLEESINQLQQALQHWQTWDAEYEALKEELETADDSTPAQIERIQDEFEGELVNRKEVNDIFGGKGQRSKDQIINIIDRRIDYVTKSIESLQKQLETAENKHAAASIISQPDAQDEEGQPITEIVEELDDDDNVVSYKLNRPGESLPHIREALQKAGVKDIPNLDEDHPEPQASEQQTTKDELPQPKSKIQPTKQPPAQTSKSAATPKKAAKKAVSFAEDTKPAPEVAESTPQVSRAARRVEDIMNTAKSQQRIENPVIPEDEDPQDAALRQEMLKYNMGEVGAVVAELQLEEGPSDEDLDEWDYSDEGFDEDEDDEDNYGRSTGRIVTEDYQQRMLELEQKLGIKSRFTSEQERKVQETDGDEDSGSDDERIGRIVVKHSAPSPSSASQAAPVKPATKGKKVDSGPSQKGVRFADSLDIAPDDTPAVPPATTPTVTERKPVVEPLSDIVERSKPSSVTETKSNRKPSRFKKAREEVPPESTVPKGPPDVPSRFSEQDRPTVPSGPEGATIAEKLVERDSSRPVDDDEFDDMMDAHELADEHQRLRRKFIQRQGGFLKEDESPIQPLDETEGGPQRPSRFKAARLSKQ